MPGTLTRNEHKFKVGDTVVLKAGERHFHDPGWVSDMSKFVGAEVPITGISEGYGDGKWYAVYGNSWTWDERWMELHKTTATDE